MTQVDRTTAIKNKDELAKKHTEYFNKTAKPLSVFEPGETVRVKNHNNDKWDQLATIISRREDNLSYVIEMQGKQYVRGRRLLKSANSPDTTTLDQEANPQINEEVEEERAPQDQEAIPAQPATPPLPRRSTRTRKPRVIFDPSG